MERGRGSGRRRASSASAPHPPSSTNSALKNRQHAQNTRTNTHYQTHTNRATQNAHDARPHPARAAARRPGVRRHGRAHPRGPQGADDAAADRQRGLGRGGGAAAGRGAHVGGHVREHGQALIYSCDGAPIKVRSFRGSEGFAAFVGSEGSVQDAATPKGSHQGPHPPLSGLADAFESTKIAIIRRLSTACGQCIRTLTASERGAHRFVCIRCLAPRAYRAALLLCSHCACVFLPPDDY